VWELCEGNLEEGSLAGDPEGYLEKALETGISFHKGSVWETWRRACLLGGFESWMKRLWGWGTALSRGSVEGASGRAPSPGNPKVEVFERYAK
jgi:hypothetical protein